MFLANKRILVGVTGSIAAYKSADLVRRLREAGALVRVVMTDNAKQFITPLTMQAVSGHPVHEALFDAAAEAAMGHIELARWAEVILIAPATADCMAKLATGYADDLLTTLCLASKAPIALAPAMNQGMWQHVLTQENRRILEKHKHIHIFGPTEGSQACGDIGPGRMLDPLEIVAKVSDLFKTGSLAGLNVLLTAGPTHEAIDPVRYITNGSSGKMGFALAEAAHEASANVTLISGPVNLPMPLHLSVLSVVTADEMYAAVMRKISECDIFIAVAAVGDYRSETIATQKIHKEDSPTQLVLVRTKDIVANVSQLPSPPFIVGFAAETENVIQKAKAKRIRKNMDMIIANQVGATCAMGSDDNTVTVIDEDSEITLPANTKPILARELIAMIANTYKKKDSYDRKTHAKNHA